MSKSSNDDNAFEKFIDQQKALDYYANLLENFNAKISTLSKTLEDSVTNIAKRELYIKDINNMSKVEIREYFNIIKRTLSDMGIELTKEAEKMLKGAEKSAITSAQRTGNISLENINNKTVNNVLANMFKMAEKGALEGQNSITIKDFTNNKVALDILKQINTTLNKDDKLDSFGYKIKAFFGEKFDENKKTFKGFARDIVEGIASSKFVGGALGDLIKLGGLQLNAWLSQFGPIGRFLGKATVILTQILGTLLSGQLISSILNAVLGKKLFGFAGNALKNIFKFGGTSLSKGVGLIMGLGGPRTMTTQMARSTLKAGTVFRDSATGGLRKVVEGAVRKDGTKSLRTVAIKEAQQGASIFGKLGKFVPSVGKGALTVGKVGLNAAKGVGGLLAGFALEAGANKAVNMGANASLAHGLSGAGQGALAGAAIGSIVPVLGTGVGAIIGAAIGGITGIIKGHFIKKEKGDEEKKNFWKELLDMLRNSWIGKALGFGGSGSSSSGGGFVDNLVGGVKSKFLGALGKDQDVKKVSSVGALELNKAGGMINIGSMNKMQASNAVLEYMNKRPDQFKNAYELVGSKYASLGSFQNDLAIRNKQGLATQAVLYAGATKNLENAWDALEKAGMQRNRAELMKYTSGRSTATSVHGKYGARSHSNVMNMVTDLAVGNQWTDAEWKKAIEVLRPIYAQQGFDLQFEGVNSKGKTVIGSNYVPGLTNKHFHVGLLKGKEGLMPDSALKNQEQQKAIAERHSIQAMTMVKELEGDEAFNKLKKENYSKSAKDLNKVFEDELKKYGITSTKDESGKEKWIYSDGKSSREFDPTGNLDFAKKQMTQMTNNEQ